jgi:PIN domain nuclease of toxin-antitoxin system
MLLDTHVLIWLDQADEQLGPAARAAVQASFEEDEACVSAITFWEVAMLLARRRVRMALDVRAWRADLLRDGLVELPVDGAIGIAASQLEDLHGDPADRMIVATALTSGARLATADHRILDWSGTLDRIDARR